MNKHILLKKAFIYPAQKKQPSMEGCTYNEKDGYWIVTDKKIPAVFDPDNPKPETKKNDIETGEDQKGE